MDSLDGNKFVARLLFCGWKLHLSCICNI